MNDVRSIKTIENKSNSFIISLNSAIYNFNIDLKDDSIIINAKTLKDNKNFERVFQLSDLQTSHKYFNFFDLTEIFKLIKKKINSESISISDMDSCLILTLIFDFDENKKKIDLSIHRLIKEDNSNNSDGFLTVFLGLLDKFKSFENVFLENSKIIRNDEIKLLSSFIKENQENMSLKRIYRGSDDGDNPEQFHKKCDGIYPTITVIETLNGLRFGGYTSVPWDCSSSYKNDIRAFVFSLSRKKQLKSENDLKSIYCDRSHFATFGSGHDIFISNKYFSSSTSYSNLVTYGVKDNLDEIKKDYFLAGSYNFIVKEMEVFHVFIDN